MVSMTTTLPSKAGMQRWTWDLCHEPPPGPRSYGMTAIHCDTPTGPDGPLASPGDYTVVLTVGTQRFTQPLVLCLDPRVVASPADIRRQSEIALASSERGRQVHGVVVGDDQLRVALGAVQGHDAEVRAVVDALTAIEGLKPDKLEAELWDLMHDVDAADAAPTVRNERTLAATGQRAEELLAKWRDLRGKQLAALERALGRALLPPAAK